MLTRIDRLQLAVPDAAAAASGWVALLGAEPAGKDHVACLGARRNSYRLGNGWVEFLEPDGTGEVADAVAARGGHLFAAGASSGDLDALVAHLREQGCELRLESGQVHLSPADTGGFGLRIVLSNDEKLPSVGEIDFFYEATLLVEDAPPTVAKCASLFALDPDAFVPIASDTYGYNGTLTLFDRARLGRFEMIAPTDPAKTLGRFFTRSGPSYYMAFCESSSLPAIIERAREQGAGLTEENHPERHPDGTTDTMFLHPPELGGMMLGLSEPGAAWIWSGGDPKSGLKEG